MGSQPESKLSRAIMNALRARGAFVWKNHGGPTMMAGLPDIAGVYRGLFIAIETKMPGNDVSTIQEHRMSEIQLAGGHVVVGRSVDQVMTWLQRIDAKIARGDVVHRPTPKTLQRPSGRPARANVTDDPLPDPDDFPFDYGYSDLDH